MNQTGTSEDLLTHATTSVISSSISVFVLFESSRAEIRLKIIVRTLVWPESDWSSAETLVLFYSSF